MISDFPQVQSTFLEGFSLSNLHFSKSSISYFIFYIVVAASISRYIFGYVFFGGFLLFAILSLYFLFRVNFRELFFRLRFEYAVLASILGFVFLYSFFNSIFVTKSFNPIYYSALMFSLFYLTLYVRLYDVGGSVQFRMSFYFLVGYYFFFLFAVVKLGFAVDVFNEIFPNQSRNFVSGLAILLQIWYSLNKFKFKDGVTLITPLLTAALCILCFGRSGIAFSLILVVFCYLFHFKGIAFRFLFCLAIMLLLFFNLESIIFIVTEQTNFSRGVDSSRTELWLGYLERIDFVSFFSGVSLNDVPAIRQLSGNPHNSFLFGHSNLGFFYILMLSVFAIILLSCRSFYVVFLSIVLFSRLFFDTIMAPSVLDYILFFVLYSLREPFINIDYK